MNRPKIMYLRDSNRNPIGCLAITVDHVRLKAEYQLTMTAPEDHFDRKMGRQMSIGRLVENPLTVRLKANSDMNDVALAIMKDIVKNKVCSGRAVKLAKLWLNTRS